MTLILCYIFFEQFFSDDEYVEFMKALPEVVFIAQDSMEDVVEQSVVPIKGNFCLLILLEILILLLSE